MSFILKALKKVEQEQADRKAAPADLQSAILTGGEAPGSAPRLTRWGGILLVFIAGSGLTYFFMQKSVTGPKEMVPQSVIPARPTALTAPVPEKTIPISGSESTPATAIAPENSASSRKITGSTSLQPSLAASPPSGRAAPVDPPATSAVRQDPAVPPPPGLKVNGIAFQDDPFESVAVINGALLKKGMSVDGARIEGIFHDRVRFSGRNGIFEVQLTK